MRRTSTPDQREGGVLLYDPDCGFCVRCATWLARRSRGAVRPFSVLDEAVTAPGVDAAGVDVERAMVEVPYVRSDGSVVWGAAAIAEALVSCRWVGWRLVGRVLRTRAVQVVARPVYTWVARHRHRLPGGTASCDLG
ncbi:thiol-disulfide oxidoreductase DCC family protein [Propionibacteriaceae bacterium G1746]|uniref:thiol-disulfide oxidoreductase DCC family protein n=1 Tax=Aestuariimicrobium sp. G57 TaxID=3418485 RepID=UPI003C2576FE